MSLWKRWQNFMHATKSFIRECLRHNISPFIIEDANRPEYLEALKAYRQNGTVTALTTLFQKEQEFYFNQCEYFFAE